MNLNKELIKFWKLDNDINEFKIMFRDKFHPREACSCLFSPDTQTVSGALSVSSFQSYEAYGNAVFQNGYSSKLRVVFIIPAIRLHSTVLDA